MDSGWIRLHRKIREHWLWRRRRRFSHFEAWVDLLLSANHSQGKVPIGSKLLTIERGQVLTSQISLAKRWRWNRKTVNAFLKLTKGDEMLDFESSKEVDTGYTLITIQNYSKYQDSKSDAPDIEADNGTDIPGTTEGQPRDTNKKNKEELKKKDMSGKPDCGFSSIIEKTIRRMNELAGTSYRSNTKVTATHINARISEGYTLEDFETVLESKWHEWKDNPDMRMFYRPQTLFSPEHFEDYLQAAKLNGNGNGVDCNTEVDPWAKYK